MCINALWAAAPSPDHINFSFDQVDVRTFVKLVGEQTGRKFVVADDVGGKITVVSPRITYNEIYPLFVSILESAGCSVMHDGDLYRVVKLPERAAPLAPVVGVGEPVPESGVITKVFRLENVRASELRKVLESTIGGGAKGAVGAIEETNHIIVTDTSENIRRVERIVLEVDQPGLARLTEVVPLKYAGASDLAEELSAALAESETRAQALVRRLPQTEGGRGARRDSVVVASPHANSLILVGTPAEVAAMKRLIEKMDVDTPSGRGRLNAIFLRYIDAEEAAESISKLVNPEGAAPTKPGESVRRITIQSSTANNALLVDAMPGDFEVVRRLVGQLDVAPEQVHISVLIAEMSLVDKLDYGVELAALDMPSAVGDTVLQAGSRLGEGVGSVMNSVQQGLFPRGLTIGAAYGSRQDADGNMIASFPGLINIEAIKRDARFKVLSETSLEAENNREATVNIVNDIPLLKSTIEGTGADRDVIENIERAEVGIKLKLTPHIVGDEEVRMVLNPTLEAIIDSGPSETQFAPTIARREVSTTVTVPNGRMIVIAGLTREDESNVVQKVPVLGSIPLLGWLFRTQAKGIEKTNVLIFVTPRIVQSAADMDEIMGDWRKKTGLQSP
jgi:general secretion pathway protein D